MTLPIRYRETANGEWASGKTLNISSTGVLFEGDITPRLAGAIEMDLILPQAIGGGARVLARGAVTRIATSQTWHDRPQSRIAATIAKYNIACRRRIGLTPSGSPETQAEVHDQQATAVSAIDGHTAGMRMADANQGQHVNMGGAAPRALVWGARGFIGRALVDHLTMRGWSVRALSRRPGPLNSCRQTPVECIELTATNRERAFQRALDGVEVVFDLAG